MSAYEMMLSESQERHAGHPEARPRGRGLRASSSKWGLDAAVIGVTTATGRIVLKHRGEVVCDLPLGPLSDDAPLYDRPWIEPQKHPRLDPSAVAPPADWGAAVLKLMACPDMASKRWLWEQYDRHVMADTLADSATGADAGVVRVHGTRKALAMTSDVTPRYVQADPYEGGKQAVAEAWRNLTAVGADPIAVTDNLNFGNPERPEIMGPDRARPGRHGRGLPGAGLPHRQRQTSRSTTRPTARPSRRPPTIGAVGLIPDYAHHIGYAGLKPRRRPGADRRDPRRARRQPVPAREARPRRQARPVGAAASRSGRGEAPRRSGARP